MESRELGEIHGLIPEKYPQRYPTAIIGRKDPIPTKMGLIC